MTDEVALLFSHQFESGFEIAQIEIIFLSETKLNLTKLSHKYLCMDPSDDSSSFM